MHLCHKTKLPNKSVTHTHTSIVSSNITKTLFMKPKLRVSGVSDWCIFFPTLTIGVFLKSVID